LYKNSYIEQGH